MSQVRSQGPGKGREPRRAGRLAGASVAAVEQEESTAPGAASAARAGVRISFAGRSAVLRRRRFGPALLRNALDAVALPSLAATAACRARHGPAASCSAPMASRLRYLVTVYGPGCLPGHRDYLKRHDSLSFDAGLLLRPVVPRERSEGLARPPTAVSDVHPARDRAHGASGSIRPRRPSIERRGASVPRGCISRRKSAILAYRVTAHWHLGVGIHELWRRACAGFPPAVWSPSLSGWLPTTPPQGGSHMAATIAPAPKRHQRNLLITLAAAALQAALAHRHYRAPACSPGESAPGVRRCATGPPGSDGAAPQSALPTNTTTARRIVAMARVTSMSGRPWFAARGTLRPFPTAISRTRVAPPGPFARTATMQPCAILPTHTSSK